MRIALRHSDRERAKANADELALAFRRDERRPPKELTLRRLFAIYLSEVTQEKGESSRQHDKVCAEMFCRAFGAERKPSMLSRREWDRFIAERRRGTIAPAGVDQKRSVRERVIAHDLSILRAVLNWATLAGDGRGGTLLDRNPLKGLPLPREEKRAVLTLEQYTALFNVAPRVHPCLRLFLVLANATGHRGSSIRQLRWSDVDLERKVIRWRAQSDKIGWEHETPLTEEAVAALAAERSSRPAIGDAWVFPARDDPAQCLSGDAAYNMWKRAAVLAKLPTGERYGWHSIRRQFASELKDIPLRDLCHLGGWKNAATPDLDT